MTLKFKGCSMIIGTIFNYRNSNFFQARRQRKVYCTCKSYYSPVDPDSLSHLHQTKNQAVVTSRACNLHLMLSFLLPLCSLYLQHVHIQYQSFLSHRCRLVLCQNLQGSRSSNQLTGAFFLVPRVTFNI